MTSEFSIEKTKVELEGALGFAFDLESSFDRAKVVGGLASSAHAFNITAVKCYLVGLDGPGTALAQKSVTWLSSAISTNERPKRYFLDGTEAARFYDLSLARWLLGENDTASIKKSVEHRERYLEGHPGADSVEVAFALVEYLDAGRHDLVKAHIRRHWQCKKMPLEVEVAQALCESEGLHSALHPAVVGLLKNMTSEWLCRGHFDHFSKWIRVGTSGTSLQNMPVPQLLRFGLNEAKGDKAL